ncbi:uncharacterized protein LOC114929510 [Nylanderia fulva]|uniref:uncharacterized protein LOC114929510 n=1 Tax=Nylanderia fulva TaxID=613905 RepID=UPI0010FB0D78|nr:uncharacterized protein LOC114929510 [Nylanderia fulva]
MENTNVGAVEDLNDSNTSNSETHTVHEEIDNNNSDQSLSSLSISDQSDEYNNDNTSDEEIDEICKLRSWAIECRIPFVHMDKLLKILQPRLLPTLPRSSTTFFKSNTSYYEIHKMEDYNNITNGEYSYFGIEQGLQFCINSEIHPNNSTMELQVNIDGIKLFKSSTKSMWPILIKIHFKPDIYKPFVAAAYVGNSKPKSVNLFLKDFIAEVNILQNREPMKVSEIFHMWNIIQQHHL